MRSTTTTPATNTTPVPRSTKSPDNVVGVGGWQCRRRTRRARNTRFEAKHQEPQSEKVRLFKKPKASIFLSVSGLRYYNPELGRWISRDPIGERGGVNLYAFSLNLPVGRVDRFGLDSICYNTKTKNVFWYVHDELEKTKATYLVGKLSDGFKVSIDKKFGGGSVTTFDLAKIASNIKYRFSYIDQIDSGPQVAIIAMAIKHPETPESFDSVDEAGIWGSWLARGKSRGNGWEWAAWLQKSGGNYSLTKFVTSQRRDRVLLNSKSPHYEHKNLVGWVHNHPDGGEGLSGTLLSDYGGGDVGSTETFKKYTYWKDSFDHSQGISDVYIHIGYGISPKGYVFKYDTDWDSFAKDRKIWP